jgi:hypothetical protein
VHEADEVAAAFAAHHGLREAARRTGGEWAALLLVAGPAPPPGTAGPNAVAGPLS